MKVLLDTHTLLWIITDDERLSESAKEVYFDTHNEVFLSLASVWELAIKISLNKLAIRSPLENLVTKHVIGNDIKLLLLYFTTNKCHRKSTISPSGPIRSADHFSKHY